MSLRRDFVGIPVVPDTGNADLNRFLSALKENIELLCNLRGQQQNNVAIVKGDITTDYPDQPTAFDFNNLVVLKEVIRKLMVDLKT